MGGRGGLFFPLRLRLNIWVTVEILILWKELPAEGGRIGSSYLGSKSRNSHSNSSVSNLFKIKKKVANVKS